LLTSTTFGVFAQRVTIPVVCPHSVRLVGVSTSDTLLSHTRFSLDAAPKVAALFAKNSPDSLQSKLLGILLRYWLRLRNPCVTRKAWTLFCVTRYRYGPLTHTGSYSLVSWVCLNEHTLRRGHDSRTL